MHFTDWEKDKMQVALDHATNGTHFKDKIGIEFAPSALGDDHIKRLVRAIIFYRGQVPDVTAFLHHTFNGFAGYRVYAPACFDGCEGEGYKSENESAVLEWVGWDGPANYTFKMEDLLAVAERN